MESELKNLENLTVAIPTYNRVGYLTRLLNSIPQNLNVVISDNGAYLTNEFNKLFPTVKIIQQNTVIEAPANWNRSIQAVDTEWFILPSDDDLYFDDSFGIIARYCQLYPEADLIIFGHKVIDENDVELSNWVPSKLTNYHSPDGFDQFKYGVDSRFPSMVFKTRKVKECGLLDESYKLTAGDSKLIQMILLSGNVVFAPEIVGGYRTWPQNTTGLSLGNKKWLKEIDRWQNDIENYIKENTFNGLLANFKRIKDEVYARNLLAGILNLKNQTYTDRWKFISGCRIPVKASLITQLRIIKTLLF